MPKLLTKFYENPHGGKFRADHNLHNLVPSTKQAEKCDLKIHICYVIHLRVRMYGRFFFFVKGKNVQNKFKTTDKFVFYFIWVESILLSVLSSGILIGSSTLPNEFHLKPHFDENLILSGAIFVDSHYIVRS